MRQIDKIDVLLMAFTTALMIIIWFIYQCEKEERTEEEISEKEFPIGSEKMPTIKIDEDDYEKEQKYYKWLNDEKDEQRKNK